VDCPTRRRSSTTTTTEGQRATRRERILDAALGRRLEETSGGRRPVCEGKERGRASAPDASGLSPTPKRSDFEGLVRTSQGSFVTRLRWHGVGSREAGGRRRRSPARELVSALRRGPARCSTHAAVDRRMGRRQAAVRRVNERTEKSSTAGGSRTVAERRGGTTGGGCQSRRVREERT